jgi:poly-gamma-glutamate system protein
MNNRSHKIYRHIVSATLFLLSALMLVAPASLYSQTELPPSPHSDYELMVKAAKRMQAAERVIYQHKKLLGLVSYENDINRTGLVGADTSAITTTQGTLTAKRTATNPDFAAYVIRLLKSKGIEKNDSILVTLTGSLPGFDLAVVIALDLLEIPNLRISSIGSSSYGANLPDMTWLDMEDILYREGLINKRSDYVTLGGQSDLMSDIDSFSTSEMRNKCYRLGYPLLEAGSREAQYMLRKNLIGEPKNFALLINAGGNVMMLGHRDENTEIPGGWISPASSGWQEQRTSDPVGIVFDFLDTGIPVLNLIQVHDICRESGIPHDAQPFPPIGTSPVYFLRAMQ